MFNFYMTSLTAFPAFNFWLCLISLLLFIEIGSMTLIALASIITDAFSIAHMFDPVRVYHFIFIFPVMCLFMLLRFTIQRREKMQFLVFSFSKWEAVLVKWRGFSFDEEYFTVEYQNNFGAKWKGADCTTTVYSRAETKRRRNSYKHESRLTYIY